MPLVDHQRWLRRLAKANGKFVAHGADFAHLAATGGHADGTEME